MAFNLPAAIYSADQLQFCSEQLHLYATALAQQRRGAKNTPLPALSPESQLLLELLTLEQRTNDEAVDKFRADIETMVTATPTITVTLAALASHGLKTELTQWFRQNIRQDLLLSFVVNPDISGGMMVRTTNRVFDFSFRKLLLTDTKRFTKALENVR